MKLLFMLLCFVCTQASNPPNGDTSKQKTETKKPATTKKAARPSFTLAPSILIF